ncbi:hypothetical protein, partial [Frankia sp. Cr1]|uniref:hypothetical protein n=1 Tax=Frankia sp. Cr1 TaxID=3073931 RepID=UPI002AD42364
MTRSSLRPDLPDEEEIWTAIGQLIAVQTATGGQATFTVRELALRFDVADRVILVAQLVSWRNAGLVRHFGAVWG